MDDDEMARLADIVSERVFASMAKLLDVVENLVRDNEALRIQVDELELIVQGEDVDDELMLHWRDMGPGKPEDVSSFFGVDEDAEEPEDDDSEPTFD